MGARSLFRSQARSRSRQAGGPLSNESAADHRRLELLPARADGLDLLCERNTESSLFPVHPWRSVRRRCHLRDLRFPWPSGADILAPHTLALYCTSGNSQGFAARTQGRTIQTHPDVNITLTYNRKTVDWK